MGQRLTNEEFISRATNIHGDEYNNIKTTQLKLKFMIIS